MLFVVILVCVQFEHDGIMKDSFLTSLLINTTSSELYKIMKEYIVNKCGFKFVLFRERIPITQLQ